MAAKKKEASVISGREEVIDKGLFGEEGTAISRDPEDTITRVAKSNPYTGKELVKLCLSMAPSILPIL